MRQHLEISRPDNILRHKHFLQLNGQQHPIQLASRWSILRLESPNPFIAAVKLISRQTTSLCELEIAQLGNVPTAILALGSSSLLNVIPRDILDSRDAPTAMAFHLGNRLAIPVRPNAIKENKLRRWDLIPLAIA